jgi:phage terminase small subunit
LTLLDAACGALDRMTQAREQIDKQGLTYEDGRGGLHPHPCISIEKDSRIALMRALRELSLDSAELEEFSRPARIGGRYAGRGR